MCVSTGGGTQLLWGADNWRVGVTPVSRIMISKDLGVVATVNILRLFRHKFGYFAVLWPPRQMSEDGRKVKVI